MKQFIYADNAATTKLSLKAFQEMQKYLLYDYSNPSQPYSFSSNSKLALKEARKIIANCINATPDEIYFTSGGTESDNWAIKGLVLNGNITNIITSRIEHHAILNSCKIAEMGGISVTYLDVTKEGVVDPALLENAITNSKTLVSVMYANNEIGSIQPIKELCAIAHKNNALFHTDAVQCVGHIKIDVKELNVDMLSASAHKFNGPKGIGFLYVKKGTNLNAFINGGFQEKGYRGGTENVAAIIGMAMALKENIVNLEKNALHIRNIEKAFISRLNQNGIEYLRNGSQNTLPGLVNISIKNSNGEMLLHRLDLMGIYISTGAACDGKNNKVSHVIKAIKVPKDYATGTIRISFGKENNIEEANIIADGIKRIISK